RSQGGRRLVVDRKEREFVERIGLFYETQGLPRIGGRILGLLILSEEPISLDGMVKRLGISKASASVNARLFERLGFIERVAVPGERKDYYRFTERQWERFIESGVQRVEAVLDLARRGQRVSQHRPAVRRRFEQMERFYELFLAHVREAVEEWRSHRRSQPEGVE
ncbi:MAG TPA: MarR family transcriptional regulator, partial [Limnochordia bacterium]